MNRQERQKYIETAGQLGWTLNIEGTRKHTATLTTDSPLGQDVYFDGIEFTDGAGLYEEIKRLYYGYDPSYEASLWLDEWGHGKNGAPYEMGDLYNDMVFVEKRLEELMIKFYNF